MRIHTNTLIHTHSCISGQWDWRDGFWKGKGFQVKFKRHHIVSNIFLSSFQERWKDGSGLQSDGWISVALGVGATRRPVLVLRFSTAPPLPPPPPALLLLLSTFSFMPAIRFCRISHACYIQTFKVYRYPQCSKLFICWHGFMRKFQPCLGRL